MSKPRMHARNARTNPLHGTVVWNPTKSLWYSAMCTIAIVAGTPSFSLATLSVCGVLTTITLCCGHSVGLHRLLIHRSFSCPRWLEYCLVYTGTLVGMGGPRKMLYMHDIRDWSQRQPECHAFYIHAEPIIKDWFWNLHCDLKLSDPPEFRPEPRITQSRFYAWLDRYSVATQLPIALLLYLGGGLPWVVWGIPVRIALSLTGHWFVGHLAHNWGRQPRTVRGAAVQGYNVHGLGLITMGEAWHNNHHAFPGSAKMGLERGQNDAGWWLICGLEKLGLAWDVKVPSAEGSHENIPNPKATVRKSRQEVAPSLTHPTQHL